MRRQPTHPQVRSDARRSRSSLTDAVERLLRNEQVDFSIPELATEAGVGVATAYRHFPAPSDALQAYHSRAIDDLVVAFREAAESSSSDLTAVQRFHSYCNVWVTQARRWGPAVRHIRSHQGFIERLKAGDTKIGELYAALDSVLQPLLAAGATDAEDIEEGSREAAVLMWTTIFDERVIYDLDQHLGWSEAAILTHLTAAVQGALHIDV